MNLEYYAVRGYASWAEQMRTLPPLALVLYVSDDLSKRARPHGPGAPGGAGGQDITDHNVYGALLAGDDDGLRSRFMRGLEEYFAGNPEPSDVTVNLCAVWREWGWEARNGDGKPSFPASFFAWMEARLDDVLAMPEVVPDGYNTGPFTIVSKLDDREAYRYLVSMRRIRALGMRLLVSTVASYSQVGERMIREADLNSDRP